MSAWLAVSALMAAAVGASPAEDKAHIRQVLHRRLGEVARCYEPVLLRRPGQMPGKLVVSWLIGPRGEVHDIKVLTNTRANRELEACFVSRLASWVFPPPSEGSARVTYTYILDVTGF